MVLRQAGGQGARSGKAAVVKTPESAPTAGAVPSEVAPALARHLPASLLPTHARPPPSSVASCGTAPPPNATSLTAGMRQGPVQPPTPILVPATPSAPGVANHVTAPITSAAMPSAASAGRCAPIPMASHVVATELQQEPARPPLMSQADTASAPSTTRPVFVAEWTQEPARMSQSTLTGARTTFPSAAPAMPVSPAVASPSRSEWEPRSDKVVVSTPAVVETACPVVVPPVTAERQREAAATAVASRAAGGTARPPVAPPIMAEGDKCSARVPVAASAGLETSFSSAAPSLMVDCHLASARAPDGPPVGCGRALASLVRPPVVAMTPLTDPSTSATMMPINYRPARAEMMRHSALPATAWLTEPSASSSLLDVPLPVSASSLLPPWATAATFSVTPALPVAFGQAGPSRAPITPLSSPRGSARLLGTQGGPAGGGSGTVDASRTTDGGIPGTLTGERAHVPASPAPVATVEGFAGSLITPLPGSQGSSAARVTDGGRGAVPGELARVGLRRADPAPSLPATNTDAAPDEPCDGVYKLDHTMQANIATLLRVLFAVQDTSDKSCMPFLGVAHYLMAFSYLVDVSAIAARELFFDGLHAAFERPATMKVFMEKAFSTSSQGLHVGGRTRSQRHVIGQPDGLREDVLRQKLNPGNAKVQWLSRRLRLRTSLDVQVGARSTTGGLTAEDRVAVLSGISQEDVCTKLAERGCTVKYARSAGKAAGPRPIALKFRWDATTTWFPGGLEASLVSGLQHDLLRGTPVSLADKETGNRKALKPGSAAGAFKRAEPSQGEAEGGARGRKRAKVVKVSSSTHALGRCRTCGHDETDVVPGTVAPAPAQLEWWSADIAKWDKLPCGGHVLVVSLPVDMDRSAAGRPYVSADIQLNSKEGAPPYRYTVHVKRSPLPAEPSAAVGGASYTTLDGQVPLPHASSHSLDILRLVRSFLCKRPGPSVAAHRGPSGGATEQGGELSLHVRSASRRAPLIERVDFVSQYELSTKAELIERSPGRMTMLWAGVEPRPMAGASTL